MTATETKFCVNCNKEKPIEEFYKRKDTADGKHYYCAQCSRDRRKAYYYARKKEKEAEKRFNTGITNDLDELKIKIEKEVTKRKMREIEDMMMILIRDDWTCQRCKTRVNLYRDNNPQKAHIDHIIPIAHGGTSVWSNLQVLCRTCNLSKGAKLEATFK